MNEKIKNILNKKIDIRESVKERIKNVCWFVFIIAIVLTIAMYWYDQYVFYSMDGYDYTEDEFTDEEYLNEEPWCLRSDNVALINIHGDIVTYLPVSAYTEEGSYDFSDSVSSEDIIFYIDEIEKNNNIKAIILEIDSYGGYPVASEEIMNAIKRAKKPTIALIREGCASGAYLAASGADKIYASEMSDVGSIGVTMSYLDYSQQNKKEGIIYQQLSSGKFKNAGDPNKELTEEEKELYMRDINIMHEAFVKKVAENRGLETEQVEKIADGSTMMGKAAKENGLIDEIGDIYDVQDWIRKEFDIEPSICVY